MFIGLDINKIKNFLGTTKKYHFQKTNKNISSISFLLTSEIEKSKLRTIDLKNLNKKSTNDNNYDYIFHSYFL